MEHSACRTSLFLLSMTAFKNELLELPHRFHLRSGFVRDDDPKRLLDLQDNFNHFEPHGAASQTYSQSFNQR